MSSCQIRDVGLIPTYTETNCCVGLMIKNIHHGVDTLGSNLIVFIELLLNFKTEKKNLIQIHGNKLLIN